MASPGAVPAFAPSQSVSSYLRGARGPTGALEQLQVNPPNLPMFKLGTVPFIGDYIDIARGAGVRAECNGRLDLQHRADGTPPVFHAVWTDNRDVKPPYTKDWTDYTPPTYSGPRARSDARRSSLCMPGLPARATRTSTPRGSPAACSSARRGNIEAAVADAAARLRRLCEEHGAPDADRQRTRTTG